MASLSAGSSSAFGKLAPVELWSQSLRGAATGSPVVWGNGRDKLLSTHERGYGVEGRLLCFLWEDFFKIIYIKSHMYYNSCTMLYNSILWFIILHEKNILTDVVAGQKVWENNQFLKKSWCAKWSRKESSEDVFYWSIVHSNLKVKLIFKYVLILWIMNCFEWSHRFIFIFSCFCVIACHLSHSVSLQNVGHMGVWP